MKKILVVEEGNFVESVVDRLRDKGLDLQIIKATTIEGFIKAFQEDKIDFIFGDMKLTSRFDNQQAEDEMKSRISEDAPLILFSEKYDPSFQKMTFCLAKTLFVEPIDIDKLYELIEIVFSSEKFLLSLLDLYSARDLAFRMNAGFRVMIKKGLYKENNVVLMEYAMMVLAIAAKNGSLSKTLTFCKANGVAPEILELVKQMNTTRDLKSDLLYIVYEYVRAFVNERDLESVVIDEVDQSLLEKVQLIIEQNEVIANCNSDYEIMWDNFLDAIVNEERIDNDKISSFFEYIIEMISKFIEAGLIDERDNFMKLINKEDYLKQIFYLKDADLEEAKELLGSCSESLITNDIEFCEDENANILSFTIKKVTIEKDAFRDNLKNESTLASTISAKDYIQGFDEDISPDLEELARVEREWESAILISDFSSIELMHDIGESILKYGRKIDQVFYEFKGISYALISLGNAILELESYDDISRETVQKTINLLELLKYDLTTWREKIFIDQNTDNLHYLDASVLVSCTTIEEKIVGKKMMEESDLELF